MTTSECSQPDHAMQAARFSTSLASSQQLCKWYYRSGTCRIKGCNFPHVRSADSFQAQASYDDRQWTLSSTEDDELEPGQQSWRFSVASYNILADKYARHYRSYLYHDVPATYLDWHHRRSAILCELSYLLPDVICLQEVDRYEDLEQELEQLGYSGIYLQRDGGRRDGCATFWRHSLLRPAVVRQVRYSHHDLKDNVALLVLFEPCHSTAQHGVLSPFAAAQQQQQQQDGTKQNGNGATQQEQKQQQEGTLDQQQQQQQEQYGQSPRQGVLGQWLPKGWLWSNNSNSGGMHHARSSQLLLRPAHSTHSEVAGSPGCVYQVPTQRPTQQQQQQQQTATGGSRGSFEAVAGTGAPFSSSNSISSGGGGGSSGRYHRKGHRRNNSGGRRQSLDRQMQGVGTDGVSVPPQQQQQQHAPDWARCALLVANTHIIFTPDKGEVKLGQARLLVQEMGQMAQWYLDQQQQQQQQQQGPAGAADGSSSSNGPAAAAAGAAAAEGGSDCATVLPAQTQAVAAILTGDYNATPNSPLYAYMSQGVLDLQTVNKRNVSHIAGSSHHPKGYRGFRRARSVDRRRSVDQQQQQQHGVAMAAAGNQLQQQQQELQPVSTAVAAVEFAGNGTATSATAARQSSAVQQNSSSSSWRASPGPVIAQGSSSSSSQTTNGAMDIPSGLSKGTISSSSSSNFPRQDSSSSSTTLPPLGSSPQVMGASPPQRQNSLGQKQYRWSDREVWRAAGMSYDELVEASLSFVSESDTDSNGASSDDQITRAAAAFGAKAAAGSGAAAAATAASAAAAAGQGAGILGSSPLKGLFAAAMSRGYSGGQPLLLQHGLKLKSSYKSVLGQEPDYTSSHSQFMDTCDYIWFTSTPITQQQQQQQNARQAGANSSSSSSSSRYELRPVAVLQPPDGMRLNKGLPAKALGSDHICLLTDFELVLRQ